VLDTDILQLDKLEHLHTSTRFEMLHMQYQFFSLLSKNKSRLIKSPACLSVSPALITSELLGTFS
jgi:hypothetical protein